MKSKLPDWRLGVAGQKALLLLLALVLPVWRAAAQVAGEARPEMAEALRQSGKIYVVVAVVVIVLTGLLFFLISLDRKLSRLEKEVAQER